MFHRALAWSGPFLIAAATMMAAPTPARADDLTGVDRILCAARSIVVCWDDGTCETADPADLNVPQFIEIDLKGRRMSTTRASGENRSTEIVNLKRDAGQIVLQGYEKGRAFSFVIAEKTGTISAAVAAEGRGVAVFGACTPMPASR